MQVKRRLAYDGIWRHLRTTSYCSGVPQFRPFLKPETSYLTIKITLYLIFPVIFLANI